MLSLFSTIIRLKPSSCCCLYLIGSVLWLLKPCLARDTICNESVCVCVCVCIDTMVCVRERERERDAEKDDVEGAKMNLHQGRQLHFCSQVPRAQPCLTHPLNTMRLDSLAEPDPHSQGVRVWLRENQKSSVQNRARLPKPPDSRAIHKTSR